MVIISLVIAGVIIFSNNNKSVEVEPQTVGTYIYPVTDDSELLTSKTDISENESAEIKTVKEEKTSFKNDTNTYLKDEENNLSNKNTSVAAEDPYQLSDEQVKKYKQSSWCYEDFGSEDYYVEISDIDQG